MAPRLAQARGLRALQAAARAYRRARRRRRYGCGSAWACSSVDASANARRCFCRLPSRPCADGLGGAAAEVLARLGEKLVGARQHARELGEMALAVLHALRETAQRAALENLLSAPTARCAPAPPSRPPRWSMARGGRRRNRSASCRSRGRRRGDQRDRARRPSHPPPPSSLNAISSLIEPSPRATMRTSGTVLREGVEARGQARPGSRRPLFAMHRHGL